MRRSVIPMSAGLLRRRDAHFSALGPYRVCDPMLIVEALIGAAQLAVANSNRLIEDLQGIKVTWLPLLSGLRSDAVAGRILDLALQQPVLSAAVVVDQTGGSMPSVLDSRPPIPTVSALSRAFLGEAPEPARGHFR
ncbi:hypothetical protein C5B85_17040 [Pseudoclavibacter sp. AY1F1]|nr:hypothetical protein C5B85_17040 [Pseudoclavibacter sp. AY1F1]